MRRTSHGWDHLPSSSWVTSQRQPLLGLHTASGRCLSCSLACWNEPDFAHMWARGPWPGHLQTSAFSSSDVQACVCCRVTGTHTSALSCGMDASCARRVLWKDWICARKLRLGTGLPKWVMTRRDAKLWCSTIDFILPYYLICQVCDELTSLICSCEFTNEGKALALLWGRHNDKGA